MSLHSSLAGTGDEVDFMRKSVLARTVSDSPSFRSKLIPATSFRPVNDYNLSQLAFDLHMAVISGYQDAVRNILMSHPGVDVNISVKGATILSLSLQKRQFHIFKLLMKHHERSKKFDLNKCSTDSLRRYEPPIITACRMHFHEGVSSLIKGGADIDSTDYLGHTALWVAARQQCRDLVEYLISHGASVNKTDIYHYTPLLTAMMYRVSSGIIRMLIMNGSSLEGPRHPANTQQSPIFWAMKYKNMEILKFLIHVGVSNNEIRYVLKHLCARQDNDEEVMEMLEAEARTPRTLKQITRCEIRKQLTEACLGKNFICQVKLLPIPTILKQYLLLQK